MAKHYTSLDSIFTALGDPTRRSILERLAQGPASVSDLAGSADMALPSFLSHVRKLEAAGLIRTAKDGRVRTCALSPAALEPARDWMAEQRAIWEARLDRFDTYVTNLMKERQNGPRS